MSRGRRDYALTSKSHCTYVLRFSILFDYDGDGLYTVLGNVSSDRKPVFAKNAKVSSDNLGKAINKIKDGMFKAYTKCLEIDAHKFG